MFPRQRDFLERFFDSPFDVADDAMKLIEDQLSRPLATRLKAPLINEVKIAQGYLYEVTVPGFAPSQLEISVKGGRVTVSGKREVKFAADQYRHHEHSLETVSRAFSLHPSVDEDTVSAKHENGMLTIIAHNAGQETSKEFKKIEIETK